MEISRRLKEFCRRFTSWTTTSRDEARLQAEIEEHLAMQTEDNVRAGMPPAEARRQAMLQFGGVEPMKETYRDQRSLPLLETLMQDVRYSLRRLRLAPAFTAATILTLAFGIGATTSIFTLIHALLLRSLPVADPDQLYRVGRQTRCCYLGGYSQDKEFSLVSYDLYQYMRDHAHGFSELAAFPSVQHLFATRRTGAAEPAQTSPGEFVAGNYFAMFGLTAHAGRLLSAADDRPDGPPVAVMSYRLWQQRYGADPSLIGAPFQINDKPFTLVGIAPPGFFGDTLRGAQPDFFLPLNAEPFVEPDADLHKYDTHWLDLIGRLRAGASPAAAEAELRVLLKQWLQAHWNEMSATDRARFPVQTLFLSPGGAGITSMREQYTHWLRILMMVTGFVLLIVCANVANLMLVRGLERRRQTSLSMALGARPSRLVRQPLIESILLSLMGGAAGLAIAFGGTRLILQIAFPSSAGQGSVPISASPSVPVLLFAFAVSLVTGIAFGIAPAWMATRVDPIEALRGAGRSTARTGSLSRKMLVVLQTALSLVLLSAAGLLTAALQNLEHQNLGFEPDRRVVANVNAKLAGYRPAQLSQLYRRLHDGVAAIPGASANAISLYAPPGGGWGSAVFVDGRPAPSPGEDNVAAWDRVTPGYFDAVGTPLAGGRAIAEQDTPASPHVAVISATFARRFFPQEDPIGKHFGRTAANSREFEIVGVVNDARYWTPRPDRPVWPMFFLPESQAEYGQSNLGSLYLHDIVVAARPGASISLEAVRAAVMSVDPNLPIVSIRPMRELVADQFIQQRLLAQLTSFFGILSLLLASIGLYGVTAYNASQRTSEIGVRIALGASRADVIRLVLRGAAMLILAGLSIGLPLTLLAGRFLGSQLHGLNPDNPAVMLAAVGALGLSALLASLVPALRASAISPLDSLRSE